MGTYYFPMAQDPSSLMTFALKTADRPETLASALRSAVASLDPEFREVIVLRELQDLSYEEIAEIAGVPVGTVRSRLFRAREELRRRLDGKVLP